MTANSVSIETDDFVIATIAGNRPVLVQKKEVDQANGSNGRLLRTDRRGLPSPASSA
jgi:hypothetical protein